MATFRITITKDKLRKVTLEKVLQTIGLSYVNIEMIKKSKSRADRLAEAASLVQDAKDIVDELQSEMEDWQNNLPENLQNGDKASQIDEARGALEDLGNELDGLDFCSIDFPGMY